MIWGLGSYLFRSVLLGHEVVEADALATPEGHRAVIGNVYAIKTQQDVSLLEGLVDWGGGLNTPDQDTLLISLLKHIELSSHDLYLHILYLPLYTRSSAAGSGHECTNFSNRELAQHEYQDLSTA